jgi:menaquinone-dependent protoporphyrinogen IX oxidase
MMPEHDIPQRRRDQFAKFFRYEDELSKLESALYSFQLFEKENRKNPAVTTSIRSLLISTDLTPRG